MKEQEEKKLELMNQKFNELYKDLKPYEWIFQHIDEYSFRGDSLKIVDEIVKYRKEISTHYIEIKRLYEKFVELYDKDVFSYVVGVEVSGDLNNRKIHPKTTDACLAEVGEYLVPIGFLRENGFYMDMFLKKQNKLPDCLVKDKEHALLVMNDREGRVNKRKEELNKTQKELKAKTKATYFRGIVNLFCLLVCVGMFIYFQANRPWGWAIVMVFCIVEFVVLNFTISEFIFALRVRMLSDIIHNLENYKSINKRLHYQINGLATSFFSNELYQLNPLLNDSVYKYYDEVTRSDYEIKHKNNVVNTYQKNLAGNEVNAGKVSIIISLLIAIIILIWGSARMGNL